MLVWDLLLDWVGIKYTTMKNNACYLVLLMIFSFANAQQKLIRPASLQKGDTVAIIAPSGILKDRAASIQEARYLLESWGLTVVLGDNLFNQQHHFSGTDEERAADFQKALDSPSIRAVWMARGGYGAVRILDRIDYSKFKEAPKWVVGFSDFTAFHNHIHNLGIETIHGMMATSLEGDAREMMETISSLKKVLFGNGLRYTITSSIHNRQPVLNSEKTIEGQLVGGNLAILASMLGSNSQIATSGKILFIEEIGEYKYSIDRMLQSLKRAGYFTNVNAVIIGDVSNVKENSTAWGSTIEKLILEVVPDNIPVLFDFPAGHEADNRALIFGRSIKLKFGVDNCSLVFKEI